MTLGIPKYINRNLRSYLTETPQKAYTMLGLSLLTVIFFGIFGLYPAISSVITTRNNINEGRADKVILQSKITDLKVAQATFTTQASAIASLNSQLPSMASGGSFIETLALLASTASVRLEFIQKTSTIATSSPENRYWVGVSGGYSNIENFLKSLGSTPRLVTIDSLALSSSSQNVNLTDTGVKATLYASVYNFVQ